MMTPEIDTPDAGCCFNCRIVFASDHEADAHYQLTGHEIGFPITDESNDWPQATEGWVYRSGDLSARRAT